MVEPETGGLAGGPAWRGTVMLKKAMCSGVLIGALFVTLSADVWDVQSDNDNTFGSSDNELVHGTEQIHDLGVLVGPLADEDWYRFSQRRESSYEVLVDSVSGDLGFSGFALQRIASDGTTIVQNAASSIYARSLRWANTSSATNNDEAIKVSGGFCGTTCGADDTYHIRSYETTISVARFNNSGTQITVVLAQNPTDAPISATLFFYNGVGALLTSANAVIAAKGLAVVPTSGIGGLAGQSGSLTIAHNGGYGSLNVKAVALEPSTGFSFDTPGTYRAK